MDNEKNIISRVLIRNTFRSRRCFESKRSLAGSGTQAASRLLVKRTSLKRVAKQRREFFWPVDTPEGRGKERVDKKKIKRKVLAKREPLLFQLVDLSACQVHLLWWGRQLRSLSSDWMVVRLSRVRISPSLNFLQEVFPKILYMASLGPPYLSYYKTIKRPYTSPYTVNCPTRGGFSR